MKAPEEAAMKHATGTARRTLLQTTVVAAAISLFGARGVLKGR
jgi:hypothetical protein